MPVDLHATAQALLGKLPSGWRTGSSTESPFRIVKRNPVPPKWEDVGGVTHAEVDLILQTSVDPQHAAQRIIDKVLNGIAVVDRAGAPQMDADAIRSIVRQEVQAAFQAVQAGILQQSIQRGEPMVEETPPPSQDVEAWDQVEERADTIAAEPLSEKEPAGEEAPKRGGTRPKKTPGQRQQEVELWELRCAELGWKLPPLDPDGFLRPHSLKYLNRRYRLWQEQQATS